MTHAELLRKHATEATNEGGIWFSGPYMDVLAKVAESLEAENAKLRELIGMIGNVCDGTSEVCEYCKNYSATNDECMMLKQMHELGMEVVSV